MNTLNPYLDSRRQIYIKLAKKATNKLKRFCFCRHFNTCYKRVRKQYVERNISLLCASLLYYFYDSIILLIIKS